MAEKFRNKYRIPSARLQSWDYGWNSAYFITICTHNRTNFFGKILNGKIRLSEIGKIAHTYWHEIPNHFPFAALGEFIAMPNHIHGIIIINKSHPAKWQSLDVQTPKLGVSSVHPEIHPAANPGDPAINPAAFPADFQINPAAYPEINSISDLAAFADKPPGETSQKLKLTSGGKNKQGNREPLA